MRRLALLPLSALATLLVASCRDTPIGPQAPTEDTVTPLFKRGGTERPIKGELSGVLHFAYDWADPECPVTTLTYASGIMSHLGKVDSQWSHCPPAVVPGYRDGHVVFTAANGDELVGEYEDADEESPFTIEIVGGTGRFEDASGTLTADFEAVGEWGADGLPIDPWSFWAVVEGAVSY